MIIIDESYLKLQCQTDVLICRAARCSEKKSMDAFSPTCKNYDPALLSTSLVSESSSYLLLTYDSYLYY